MSRPGSGRTSAAAVAVAAAFRRATGRGVRAFSRTSRPVLHAAIACGLVSAFVTRAESTDAGIRWIEVQPDPRGRPGFTAVPATPDQGIAFTNRVDALLAHNNQILENGAGVALGDVDGDGRCDVYLCGSEPANALFRNLGGWRFADVTAASGVACANQFSTGAALADVDGDRDLDLLVNGLGVGTRLFRNDGHGCFEEVRDAGLSRNAAATSLALADVDGDGDLDLYVATYRVISARSEMPPPRVEARRVDGRWVVSPSHRFSGYPLADGRVEIAEKGEPDTLYLNDGRGRFRPVSWTEGAFLDEAGRPLSEAPDGWGLSALLRDLDGDGAPDLYVCNDFFRSPDHFFRNDGTGRFRAVSPLDWRCMSLSSMAADAADLDRDGHDDLLVVEMLSRDHAERHRQRANAFHARQQLPITDPRYRPEEARNTLFRSRGDGSFAEIASFAGLAATGWSWNLAFLDLDLDGYEDLLVTTGNQHDVLDLDAQDELDRAARTGPVRPLDFYRPLPQRPLLFRNRGDLTFEDMTSNWGRLEPGVAQGLALADLDGDGDLDGVVNRLNQPALLLRNEGAAPRIAVRLRGRPPNTRGLGARLRLRGGPVEQSQQVIGGGRYLSADEAMRVFAAGTTQAVFTLEIDWRDGRRSVHGGLIPNRIYEFEEPPPDAPRKPGPDLPPAPPPSFVDVSERLGHVHVDQPPDEASLQPLLPYALDRLGPGVTWCDLDDDGRDDLVIGSGRGGTTAAFLNRGAGRFASASDPSNLVRADDDQTSVLPWKDGAGSNRLVIGGMSPDGSPPTRAGFRFAPADELAIEAPESLPPIGPGPLSMADIDGDGDLDLFVGARHVPGRFPSAPASRLFRSEPGRWRFDAANRAVLESPGMVSGSVFTDFDGDGDPDLVLAVDWGPVRLLRNDRGVLSDVTSAFGLDRWTGLWKGIAVGDFDEDGHLDWVVSNLGRNTRHQWVGPVPWRLYGGDFDGNGTFDLLEAFRLPDRDTFVPWTCRDRLLPAVPAWSSRIPNHAWLGTNSVDLLLGDAAVGARVVEANTFDHCLFLRRGNRFEVRPLPPEAQFAPGFGIAVADFDGDTHEDCFLAQNWFDFDLDSPRAAAGRGLLLLGDGRGGFRAVPSSGSGISIDGQQRGAAIGDFDGDGRPDLCVAQHAGPTRLFRNQGGRPGLRVRLRGPSGNPEGVGARMRLAGPGRTGPAREVHSGSGYQSRDSAVGVLGRPDGPLTLRVDWPGGGVVTCAIPPEALEVSVDPGGVLRVTRESPSSDDPRSARRR